LHVPRKAEARGRLVVDLDVTAPGGILVVETVVAQPEAQEEVRRHLPVVLDVIRRIDGGEGACNLVLALADIRVVAGWHHAAVADRRARRGGVHVVVVGARTGVVPRIVGNVLFVVV